MSKMNRNPLIVLFHDPSRSLSLSLCSEKFELGYDDGHSLMSLVVHSYDHLLSLVVTEIHGLVVLTYDPLSLSTSVPQRFSSPCSFFSTPNLVPRVSYLPALHLSLLEDEKIRYPGNEVVRLRFRYSVAPLFQYVTEIYYGYRLVDPHPP